MIGSSLGNIIFRRVVARIAWAAALVFAILGTVILVQASRHPSLDTSAKAVALDPPLYNWYVCEDLGFGDVPGVPDPRVRLRLCHNQGWEILAYCLQPNLLAPPLDTTCENTSGDTYWCGDNYQLLSAYDILITPTPTTTNTNTPTATATAIPSNTPTATALDQELPLAPTVTATPRSGPGGKGNLEWISLALVTAGSLLAISVGVFAPQIRTLTAKQMPVEIEIPFAHPQPKDTVSTRPIRKGWLLGLLILLVSVLLGFWLAREILDPPPPLPAASYPLPAVTRLSQTPHATQSVSPSEDSPTPTPWVTPQAVQGEDFPPLPPLDARLDLSPQGGKIELYIDPPGPLVNRGKPIEIAFTPGNTCIFGDHRACVTSFEAAGGQYNHYFLSIHSGVGGEGQAFRHALEGTGINRAGYSLDKVEKHIKNLLGARVAISQGGDEIGGFILTGLIRIPPEYLETYLSQPVSQAIHFATNLDPAWASAIDPERPMLIFETCGWKMPSEPWYPGVTSTTGSIYLAVIQPLP